MPAKSPTVPSLILDKIDHLETNLSGQIHDMNANLGGRITELAGKVSVQNGRVGKLESCVTTIQTERAMEANPSRLNRKQVGITLSVGGAVGAVVIKLLTWLAERAG